MKRRIATLLCGASLFAASSARADTFAAGSFIIPMDTTYQNSGMLKAYGLLYNLLRNGVPVQWTINPNKAFQGVDFTATAIDHKTNAAINAYGYRGGPFVIDASNAAAALPLINAWQMANATVTVHKSTMSFTAPVAKYLLAAPRVAMFADGNEGIARGYLQAAGIPDSTLNATWPNTSPDMLSPVEVSGPTTTRHDDGALFDAEGDPVYCQFMSMHWGVNNAQGNPEVVAEVRQFLQNPTHFFAECQAVNAFENLIPYGRFLTPNGYLIKPQPNNVLFHNFGSPFAQIDGAFQTVGGSEPAYALPAGDSYKAGGITMITEANSIEGQWDLWMTGYLDGACPPGADGCGGLGKVSYLGGHQYTTNLPISSNPKTQGVRLFLNSLFDSECASASGFPTLYVNKTAPATTVNSQVTFTINYSNSGPSVVLNAVLIDTIPAGSTFVSATNGGTFAAGKVTWNLGNLGANEFGVVSMTVNLGSFGTYTNTAHLDYKLGLTSFGKNSNQTSTIYDMDSDGDGIVNSIDNCPTHANPLQDLSIDILNCGMCGNVCPSSNGTPSCVGGMCYLTCSPGFSNCNANPADGCEYNNNGFSSDPSNCGGCGVACSPANGTGVCVAGACSLGACSPGYSNCNNNPVDGCEYNNTGFATDPANCGSCGNQCAAGFVCLAGMCVVSNCPSGFSDCNGLPADGCEYNNNGFSNDPANCGGCRLACNLANANSVCMGGACGIGSCAPGYSNCNGLPADGCEYNNSGFGTDTNNCGGCGIACAPANGSGACSGGMCSIASCNIGFSNCDNMLGNGCEYNNTGFGTDPANCGGCGIACAPANGTGVCIAGACTVGMCSPGYVDLDGNPVNGCEYACVVAAATDSSCNGKDDDCDGQADEEYAPTTCGVGACVASSACNAGMETCVPAFPQAEGPPGSPSCVDGIDNNCNGSIDSMDAACASGCMTNADCDDANPCTNDTCSESACTHIGIPNCGAGGMGGAGGAMGTGGAGGSNVGSGGMGTGGIGTGGTGGAMGGAGGVGGNATGGSGTGGNATGGSGTGGSGTGGDAGATSTSSSSSNGSSSGKAGEGGSSSETGSSSSGGADPGDQGTCTCRVPGSNTAPNSSFGWLAFLASSMIAARRRFAKR